MNSSSPISSGFGIIFRRPSLPLAEVAWRWSFATAAWFLGVVFFEAYAASLRVNALDGMMLRSGQPALIARALHRIFSGSGLRFTTTGILLALALVVGWIVLASFSRLAIVRTAASELGVGLGPNTRALRSLLFLNFLRVSTALAAIAAIVGPIILASDFRGSAHLSLPVAGLLIGLCWFTACISWIFLNWLFSFMIVLAPLEHDSAPLSSCALRLLSRRTGTVFLIGIIFGCCHVAVAFVAWVASSTLLGLSGAVPLRGIAAIEAVVVMAYCALADFFYTGRMAAYVSLLRPEEQAESVGIVPPLSPRSISIDKDELILSDVPLLPA